MPASPKKTKPVATRGREGGRNDVFSVFTSQLMSFGRDELAVAFVYFVQGVIGLSSLAVTFYLKDKLKLESAQVAALATA